MNIESGLELFQRAKERPNQSTTLNLFDGRGPDWGDFIEVTGESSNGKTFILTTYIIRCALPKQYKQCQLPGENLHVTLINTDHKFDLLNLSQMIKQYLKNIPGARDDIQDIIQACLRNVSLLNCYDNNQYLMTLYNLENIIKAEEGNVVVIDSICPYYWTYRLDYANVSFASYCNNVLKILKEVTKFKNVVHFYARDVAIKIPSEKVVDFIQYIFNVEKVGDSFLVSVESKKKDVESFKFSVSLELDINVIVNK